MHYMLLEHLMLRVDRVYRSTCKSKSMVATLTRSVVFRIVCTTLLLDPRAHLIPFNGCAIPSQFDEISTAFVTRTIFPPRVFFVALA